MALETTTTTLTELVQAEIVAMTIKAYLIDANVIIPLCQYASLAGQGSKVMSFPLWTKNTAVDITEATAMSNKAFDTSEVSVTVAQVGILREITDFVAATAKIGEAALFNAVVQDGVALVTEMLEDDLAALFASATGATVGTSGSDITIANHVEAIAKMRTQRVRGNFVAVYDDQQAFDLMAAVAATTGTPFAGGNVDQSVLNAGSSGYVGSLMNVPIWMSNLTDTANTAADVVGSMFADGGTAPEYCAYTWVELWAPRLREVVVPGMPSRIVSTTFAYGSAATHPTAAIAMITDA